jgi:hypothetical protein
VGRRHTLADIFNLFQLGTSILSRGHNRTQSVLVNQQLTFDCSNLSVNHSKAVHFTATSEGDVLYMIRQYFRLG